MGELEHERVVPAPVAAATSAALVRRGRSTESSWRAATDDLLRHPKFLETHYQLHHGGRKSEHLERSARYAWWFAAASGADRRACARAGLLHDLHSRLGTLSTHGSIAASVAAEIGESPDVCRAIVPHMYPLGPAPTTREGWVLVVADKVASVVDMLMYAARLVTGEGVRMHRMLRRSDPFLRKSDADGAWVTAS